MTNTYEILDGDLVVNTILASEEFVAEHYAGSYRLVAVPAPEVAPVVEDSRLWLLDEGPFKDRLGMDGLAIAASSHDACKACVVMLANRLCVDLKGEQVSALLDILIATEQPTPNPIFPGSGPMTAEKKVSILTTRTTEAERHIKGLPEVWV